MQAPLLLKYAILVKPVVVGESNGVKKLAFQGADKRYPTMAGKKISTVAKVGGEGPDKDFLTSGKDGWLLTDGDGDFFHCHGTTILTTKSIPQFLKEQGVVQAVLTPEQKNAFVHGAKETAMKDDRVGKAMFAVAGLGLIIYVASNWGR
jgi:hypothetical protein